MARGGSRPGAGRHRKDPELKKLTGNFRQDRDGAVADHVPEGQMTPPLHLSRIAQGHFTAIAAMLAAEKRCSPHHAEHVALLAQRLEQIALFQSVIEMEGVTFTSRTERTVKDTTTITEMKRAHPAVAMLSDAMRHAQSLLGELLLNPSAALKIATGKKQEDDGWGDF